MTKPIVKQVLPQQFDGIPNKIKIGVEYYTMHYTPDIFEDDKKEYSDVFGACNTTKKFLFLNPIYPESNLADTMIHEIYHAIYKEFGMHECANSNKGKMSEEYTVRMTATGFTQVMQDNPALRTWFLKQWARK